MNYTETLEYIQSLQKYGSVPGLENMERLSCALNHPENDLNIIHIAGTNGKGSTGAFIDGILRSAGYNVCRYVSPTIFEYEERFQFNGKNISHDELSYFMTLVKRAADSITAAHFPHPTPFETETALAFLYFRSKQCDYAIMETGMGGRLDAVNVIKKSRISVITSISMDHTAFLGDTIEKIAYEKAGIIKENGTVVSAVQSPDAAKVIESVSIDKHAHLTFADKISNVNGNVFDYDDMRDVKISLDGDFQVENAAAAIEVCSELGISEEDIRSGLAHTKWRARFETICKKPVIIVDGAHNPDAAEKLSKTLRKKFGGRRMNFILGVLRDKDYDKIAAYTAPLAQKIYTVTPNNPRGLDAAVLAETVKKYNTHVEASDTEKALEKCMADTDAVTVVFGSLSYLGDLIRKTERLTKMKGLQKNEKMQ